MPFVGKSVKTRPEADCEKSYSFLVKTQLYFISQNAFTAPTAKGYVEQLFKEAPQAKEAVDGKLAVVTGVTMGGAGYHMTEELALAGMHVILMGRNEDKLKDAMASIVKEAEKRGLQVPTLYETKYDLNSLKSAKSAADFAIKLAKEKYDGKLTVLVNNAGAACANAGLTEEGVETNTGRNHLCPFYLTELLIPILKAAATKDYKPRVVDVASMGHALGTDFEPKRLLDFPKQGGAPEGLITETEDSIKYTNPTMLDGTFMYCRGKMGVVASSIHLQKLHPELNFTTQHPGSICSNFGNELGISAKVYYYGFYIFQYSPSQGAATALRAALDPDFNSQSDLQGAYLHADGNPWTPHPPKAKNSATGEVYTMADYAKDSYECTEKLIAKLE